jgi:transmembrane sensor
MTQSNQGIDITAAEWAVRLNERALTAEEQIELDQWLTADNRHPGALLRARAAWANLDRLAALAGSSDPPLSPPAQSLLRRGGEGSIEGTDERGAFASHLFWNRRRFVAGATMLFLGAASTWWIQRRRDATYVSKLGQIRRVTLSDGSQMVLNTATEATVHFDEARREIKLAAGEGLFEVTQDPARPFIVRAGFVSVRVVGTVFAVRTVRERVDITVTEGVVELFDENAPGERVIRRVAANEHASVTETRQVEVQSMLHNEAERRLAWREGMVDFAGESLAIAVVEINRHNHRQIVVDDPALASRPVVGLFRATDPDNFAATVAAALGAKSVVQDDAIHLRLSPAP